MDYYNNLIQLKNEMILMISKMDTLIKKYETENTIFVKTLDNRFINININHLNNLTYGEFYKFIQRSFNNNGDLYMIINGKKIIKGLDQKIEDDVLNLIKLTKEIHIIFYYKLPC